MSKETEKYVDKVAKIREEIAEFDLDTMGNIATVRMKGGASRKINLLEAEDTYRRNIQKKGVEAIDKHLESLKNDTSVSSEDVSNFWEFVQGIKRDYYFGKSRDGYGNCYDDEEGKIVGQYVAGEVDYETGNIFLRLYSPETGKPSDLEINLRGEYRGKRKE